MRGGQFAKLQCSLWRVSSHGGFGCSDRSWEVWEGTPSSWASARQMFEGEMASLEALQSTGLVRVPRPIKVIDLPGGGAAFVMEHLKMRGLSSQAARLGEQLADLHLHNQKLGEKSKEEESTVGTLVRFCAGLLVCYWSFLCFCFLCPCGC
uniref:protein-ribulosamine 3-kinase n=1 Tax=Neovison vison TaxID=452646 RepID=A0A8C7C6E6_NEOVI